MNYTKTVTVKAMDGDYRWVRNYRTPRKTYEICVCRRSSVDFPSYMDEPRPTYDFRTLRTTPKSKYGIDLYVGDDSIGEGIPTQAEIEAAQGGEVEG